MQRRPLSITIIGWLFICVGCGSLVSHTWRFVSDAIRAGVTSHDVRDLAYAQCSAVLALVGGAFVLRGRTWARWLCAVWLALHVVLSMLHSLPETIVFFVAISYVLFRPRVAAYFRGEGTGARHESAGVS